MQLKIGDKIKLGEEVSCGFLGASIKKVIKDAVITSIKRDTYLNSVFIGVDIYEGNYVISNFFIKYDLEKRMRLAIPELFEEKLESLNI